MQKYIILIMIICLTFPTITSAQQNSGVTKCKREFFAQKPSAFETCSAYLATFSSAKKANPTAQRIMGSMYYWGWGKSLDKDYRKSVTWYKRAALNGEVSAKFALGIMYEQGKGVGADYARAVKWLKSSANSGHINAQFNLANMISKGAGTRQNQQRATMWYKRSANQGDAESAFNLGNRYAKGLGVEKNYIESYKWFLIAKDLMNIEEASPSLELLETELTKQEVKQAKQQAKSWKPKRENNTIIY